MKYNDKNKPLVCMMTQSTCYKGTRKFTPKGILWHDTGANNPTLKRYVQPDDNASNRAELISKLGKNQYNNDWNHIDRQAGMNCWVGKLADGTVATVQTMPWDFRPWGCGSGSKGSCNDTHIQFEICEDGKTDRAYLEAAYREACEITAYLCKMFGIDPHGTIDYKGDGLRYEGLKGCADYRKAAQIIKDGGYATSLTYVDNLCNIIERWHLIQYDVLQPAIVTEPTPSEPEKTVCTAAKVIAVAVAEIGYHEKASNSQLDSKTANSGSANYTKYARDFDQKYPNWYNGKKNGYAWCDMFVDWCFLTAFGYETALKLLCQPEKSAGAGCTYSLRYFKNKGQFHTSGPKPGDQIFFGISQSDSSHTGLVEKVDGSKVYTIEGNSSDQVIRRSYALNNSRILGYGRPAYDAVEDTTPTTPAAPATSATPTTTKYYRVRKSWKDKSSQIGAFTVLQNAVNCVDANPGYAAFDDDGNQVYPEAKSSDVPFKVRVSIDDLNIRKGAGTNYRRTGEYTGKGTFTIVEVASGKGSNSGWGKLKSGAGWISLDYAERL